MKLHQIALATAVLVAGTANAAMTPADVALVNGAQSRIISISGASAVQKGFTEVIARMFTGTPVYFSKASGAGASFDKADYIGVAGTLASGAGNWSGKTAIVLYRVKGGSAYGVNPVARNAVIDALKVDATCGANSGNGTSAAPYDCNTSMRVPDAGVSDVAPKFFKQPYNTEGETAADALNETELSVLNSKPIYGLAFGVPVTSTVPASTKFTRSLLSAIMTGNVATWADVDGTSGDIVVCRRTPGSGTQAVMNMWANSFPCSGAYNAPADRDASGAWDAGSRTFTAGNVTDGLIVIENSSSSEVATCLDKAVTGGTYTTKDRDGESVTVNFGTGGYKAVGVLSMDSLAKSKAAGNWQFRALDGTGNLTWDNTAAAPVVSAGATGKLPTLATYENGDWDLQGWVSFNIPSRTTGDKLDVLNQFVAKAQDPAVLAAVTDLKNVAAGIPDTDADYSGPNVLDAVYLNGDQCAPYSRNHND